MPHSGQRPPLKDLVVIVARRLHREVMHDAVPDTAAQLGYYFMLSLFPFLFVLVALAAYLPIKDAAHSILHRLEGVMPPDAMAVVHAHAHELLNEERPQFLTVGVLLTFFAASRGVDSLRKGLNLAWDVRESRSIWRTQTLALGMTIAGAALVLASFSLLVLGSRAGAWAAARVGLESEAELLGAGLRWPLTGLLIMFVIALCYWVLPNVRLRFRLITPGSIFATLAWLAATWGFTQYVEHFGRFNAAYGSIAGVVVLLLWLYLTGFVILLGSELDAAIALVSHRGPPPSGQQRERGDDTEVH